MMHREEWMKLRAFKPLRDAGASWAEIARAAGCDWRTAKKYLEQDTSAPPSYGPRRSTGKVIDPYTDVIDAWLRADPHLKASVIHERLAADPYNFGGHYQRVKEVRARPAAGGPGRARPLRRARWVPRAVHDDAGRAGTGRLGRRGHHHHAHR